MPWSPSFDHAVPDPRLDPYRNRAARLLDGEATAGHVLVESDFGAEVTSGWLWWRQWAAPAEFAIVFSRIGDDGARTTGIASEDLGIFDRWTEAGFVDGDRVLRVEWLDEIESQVVHDEVFVHEH